MRTRRSRFLIACIAQVALAAVSCSGDRRAAPLFAAGSGSGGSPSGGAAETSASAGRESAASTQDAGSAAPTSTPAGDVDADADAGAASISSPAAIRITGSGTPCPGAKSMPPEGLFAECRSDICTNAHCVSKQLVPATLSISLLMECPNSSDYCVPDDFIATAGEIRLKTCNSVIGGPGRCMSACLLPVAARYGQLPQADCASDERCAPCWDPADGSDTGVCSRGCDVMPPASEKVVFAVCGQGLGLCVPVELVPGGVQAPVDSCAQPNHACAPAVKVQDPSYQFQACTPSFLDSLGLAPASSTGQKGGCVPAYLPAAAEPAPPAGSLLQDGCASGEVCSPCVVPFSSKLPPEQTGACPL